jgi:hypothetical protein
MVQQQYLNRRMWCQVTITLPKNSDIHNEETKQATPIKMTSSIMTYRSIVTCRNDVYMKYLSETKVSCQHNTGVINQPLPQTFREEVRRKYF